MIWLGVGAYLVSVRVAYGAFGNVCEGFGRPSYFYPDWDTPHHGLCPSCTARRFKAAFWPLFVVGGAIAAVAGAAFKGLDLWLFGDPNDPRR